MKRSLSVKLSLISVGAMAIAMTAGIAITYGIHNNIADSYVESRVNLTAVEASGELDDSFIAVGNVVSEVKLLAEKCFPSLNELHDDLNFTTSLELLKTIYSVTASNTNFVCNYWFALNPTYTENPQQTPEDEQGRGFFYVRKTPQNEVFESFGVANVLKYDIHKAEDLPYVNWWTGVSRGENAWMKPYYNANTRQNMITYAMPVFTQKSEFIAAAGIDLFFDEIVDSIKKNHAFQDGHAFLVNSDDTIAYHPNVETYSSDGKYAGTSETFTHFLANMQNPSTIGNASKPIYRYDFNGVSRVSTTIGLQNKMNYGISVRSSELYNPFIVATTIPALVFVIISILLAVALFFIIRRSLKPLHELSLAAGRVKEGDLGAEIHSKTNDEIGELSDAFGGMVQALRSERSAMSALAFQDGLTGVKNKNAHAEKVASLNRQIRDGVARFAVVMCDVNDLKTINDGKGHVAGDAAIRGSCLKVCHTFVHSPVFRIGGDEFVAILEGEDYDNRDALLAKLQSDPYTDDSHQFSYSVGMATYQHGVDGSFASVFSRADEMMYQFKKAFKEQNQ